MRVKMNDLQSKGVGRVTYPREWILARRHRWLKWAGVYLAVLLLVCAIIFTLSLTFTETHYGLTRLSDLGGHLA